MAFRFGTQLTGQWQQAARIVQELPRKYQIAMTRTLKAEAEAAIKELKESIPPTLKELSEGTLLKRKFENIQGSTPLKATGLLMKNIEVVQLPGGNFFVGIKANKRHTSGGNLAKIMSNHEKGFYVAFEPTKEQLAYLMALYGSSPHRKRLDDDHGGGLIIYHVPPRPLFGRMQLRLNRSNSAIARRALERLHAELNAMGMPVDILG